MATHSSILAWSILWTEEPGALQSIGSPRVGHDHTTKRNRAWASQVALVQMQETESLWVQFLHQEGPMEEGVATHWGSFAQMGLLSYLNIVFIL